LYNISKFFENPSLTIDGLLQGIVNLIALSMQYPGMTNVRIIYKEKEFKSELFEENPVKKTFAFSLLGDFFAVVQSFKGLRSFQVLPSAFVSRREWRSAQGLF
jgi:hypothetical protein